MNRPSAGAVSNSFSGRTESWTGPSLGPLPASASSSRSADSAGGAAEALKASNALIERSADLMGDQQINRLTDTVKINGKNVKVLAAIENYSEKLHEYGYISRKADLSAWKKAE